MIGGGSTMMPPADGTWLDPKKKLTTLLLAYFLTVMLFDNIINICSIKIKL
jgi:hypothetical protein